MLSANNIQDWLTVATNNPSEALARFREQGIADLSAAGLPTTKDEEWRYSRLSNFRKQTFSQSSSEHVLSRVEEQLPAQNNAARYVLANGQLVFGDSNTVDGVSVKALQEASEASLSLLGSIASSGTHGFLALNAAMATGGLVIDIDNNVSEKTIIEIVYVGTEGNNHHYRNLIQSGVNSQITVVERFIGDDSGYFTNSVTEIVAKDGAKIDHYRVQQDGKNSFHIGGVYANLERNSVVNNHNIVLGGLEVRNDVVVNLVGEGAHTEMNGLVIGDGKRQIDNFTEVSHLVPHCTSDEYYKTILDDSAKGVFRGRIIVEQDAQKTDAEQQNNNLLLSPDAEADSKPQLEIYADDVKCSHGATVGQLSEASLFYLQSRGIERSQAQQLLTFAFANEVIERINVDSIKSEMKSLIAGSLLENLVGSGEEA